MCFSAAASFAASGGLAAAGAATLALRPPLRALPFAAIPAIFALHQAIEGMIWLETGAGEAVAPALKLSWLVIAQILWPSYIPLAVLLMERAGRRRRQALAALLVAGLIVSGAFLAILIRHDYSVVVAHGNLRYATDLAVEKEIAGLYILAATAPLLLSGRRFVLLFGVAVLTGSVVTQLFFAHAGPSVWCFFAAISSVFVYLHMRELAQERARLSPP